jgi:hypothetical protein
MRQVKYSEMFQYLADDFQPLAQTSEKNLFNQDQLEDIDLNDIYISEEVLPTFHKFLHEQVNTLFQQRKKFTNDEENPVNENPHHGNLNLLDYSHRLILPMSS